MRPVGDQPLFDISGHVALVTGANHGIGAATARLLAGCGASVILSYLRLQDRPDPGIPVTTRENRARTAEHLVESIKGDGGVAMAIEADLSDESVLGGIFDGAESNFGPIDILVNNASGWIADTFDADTADRFGRSLRRVSAETFDQQFGVDARATALLISEFALRHVRHDLDWGRIVGLTSGGVLGTPEEVSYGAAKSALESYTISAAVELASRGITANVVHPPVTDTGWVTDEVRRHVENDPYLIHVAQPEDIADVIGYLVSDDARLITGNIIHLR